MSGLMLIVYLSDKYVVKPFIPNIWKVFHETICVQMCLYLIKFMFLKFTRLNNKKLKIFKTVNLSH